MKHTALKFTLLASTLLISFQPATAEAFNPKDKEELGQFVREYLMENPEAIFDAVEKFQTEMQAKAEVEARDLLVNSKDILIAPGLPSIGNPDGDITVVEFFDYNCGYCKRALPDIVKLVEEDKNVRVVFHEMPILSDSSRLAAMWALAAHKQDKYFEYHSELMKHRGAKTADELKKIAKKLKLDVKQMEADAKSPEVRAEIASSMELAKKLGITGTPAFIVGDEVFKGYIGHDAMAKAIKQQREG